MTDPLTDRFAELRAPAQWQAVDFISDLHLQVSDPATFDVAVPIDLTLAGFALYTQVVRFGGGISLTNACDAVIGF